MNEAQLGLVLITPTLLAFTYWMHRQGAIPTSGAVIAATLAVTIATTIFLIQ